MTPDAPAALTRTRRRGLPVLLAGLGLLAYAILSPQIPRERRVSYRFPRAAEAGSLGLRWTEVGAAEPVREARFHVEAGQNQTSHDVELADGEYLLEAELPAAPATLASRRVHVDTDAFTIVFE